MDLSLWDPPDDQGYPTPSSSNQSGYNTEDNWQYHSSLGHGCAMIKEDFLNEKSCVQVLRILIDKADEEIIKLEEDIVMLQCQLAWVDEDWSKPCSAALGKEIDSLDYLIQIKKEITELHCNLQIEPHRLHDVVKPLLESYFLVKGKQFSELMDLSLCNPPDDQGYRTPSYMTEEDASNEKSCVQVLRKSIDKADEEIIKLEEDIVMLQCQLAWIDEDWSKPCSAALEKEIDSLDNLIQIKKKITELDFNLQVEPHRLHAVVKPLLENYFLVKSKQVERSVIERAAGLDKKTELVRTSKHNKEIQAKKPISLLEDNKGKSPFMEPEEKRTMNPEQPFNPMVEMRKRDTVISKAKDAQHRFENEGKVANSYPESRETEIKISETVQPADVILASQSEHVKQLIEDSSKTRKSKAYTHAINKNSVSQKPSGGIKLSETNKVHERTEAMEAPASDKRDVEGVPVNSSLPMKDVHSLTLNDLHIMARERKLRGYSKLRKEELQKLLGLEPQDSEKIT